MNEQTVQRENEGYVITDSMHIGSAEFVIGQMDTRFGTMYVTWQCKDRDNYFWGHYLNSRQAAEQDLLTRAQHELEYQTAKLQESARKHKERERGDAR